MTHEWMQKLDELAARINATPQFFKDAKTLQQTMGTAMFHFAIDGLAIDTKHVSCAAVPVAHSPVWEHITTEAECESLLSGDLLATFNVFFEGSESKEIYMGLTEILGETIEYTLHEQLMVQHHCSQCKATDKPLSTCSSCKLVRYCQETCQHQHWKAGHKNVCKRLKQ